MKSLSSLSTVLFTLTTALTFFSGNLALGLSATEVGKIAAAVTLRIDGKNNGSGVIVQKYGNTYTILTNCHVIETPGDYTIITPDKQKYIVTIKNPKTNNCHSSADLAQLSFSSNKTYQVVEIGNTSELTKGMTIYVSGWVGTDPYNPEGRGYRFFDGKISSKRENAGKGYNIVHTANTFPGMSGGPMFNEVGQLIGVNGEGLLQPGINIPEFFAVSIDIYADWVGIDRGTVVPPSPTPRNTIATIELEDTLKGYSNHVNSVAISSDGQHIVIGSSDNTIKVLNLATGELERILKGHSGWVNSVAISPNGQHIVSGSGDNTIKVWNLTTGRLEGTLEGHSGSVLSVAISPDGKHIVSGSKDNTIKVWNLATGQLEDTLKGHSDWVRIVVISPDGQHIVSGSSDDTLKVWNLATGKLEDTLKGHSDWVLTVAISPDGKHIVSGSSDDTIKVWNLATGELERTLTDHSKNVDSVAISSDGQHIVSGSSDDTIKIWRVR